MRYKVEEYAPGRFSIVTENGSILLYDDVSDLYPEQRELLAKLHSEDEAMDWETAWDIIQQGFPEREPVSDFVPGRWY
jgi:hypothetical protein